MTRIIIVVNEHSSNNNNIIIIIVIINPLGIPDWASGIIEAPWNMPVARNKDWATMTTHDRTDQQRRT